MGIDTKAIILVARQAAGLPTAAPALPSYAASTDETMVLRRAWERARTEVEDAMDRDLVPGYAFVFAPYIETLQRRILDGWGRLGERATFEACLRLIAKTEANPGAMLLGYEFLRTALDEAHLTLLAEEVGDLEMPLLIDHAAGRTRHAAAEGPNTEDAGGTAVPEGAVSGEAVGGAGAESADADETETAASRAAS